jgi:hypothetical protein
MKSAIKTPNEVSKSRGFAAQNHVGEGKKTICHLYLDQPLPRDEREEKEKEKMYISVM